MKQYEFVDDRFKQVRYPIGSKMPEGIDAVFFDPTPKAWWYKDMIYYIYSPELIELLCNDTIRLITENGIEEMNTTIFREEYATAYQSAYQKYSDQKTNEFISINHCSSAERKRVIEDINKQHGDNWLYASSQPDKFDLQTIRKMGKAAAITRILDVLTVGSVYFKKSEKVNLMLLFKEPSKYLKVIEILANKGYCDKHTKKWIDKSGAYKKTFAGLMKDLFTKDYLKRELTNKEIINIGEYTFGVKLEERTIHKAYLPEIKGQEAILPYASTLH